MNRALLTFLLTGSAILLSQAAAGQTMPDTSSHTDQGTRTEADILRQQLAAQLAINLQLRQRLQQLEQRLLDNRKDEGPLVVGLDANAAKPPVEAESDSANTAIEQALLSKGLVLLPAGSYRLTPSFSWAHTGQYLERQDSYRYGLSLDAGLPWGMAASISAPYVQRDYSLGNNDGLGDVTLSLSKKLTNESANFPSLVARLDYTHDNGRDAFAAVPVGGGFRTIDVSLSAVKRVEPLALYGTLSYGHSLPKSTLYLAGDTYLSGRIEPADRYGLGIGVSLAATPEISLDAGATVDFRGKTRVEPMGGEAYMTTSSTFAYMNLGASFVLHRNLLLSVRASAGVSKDADDFLFSVALPYRF